LNLAYAVKKDEGKAQFDKSTKRLIINLPVKPQQTAICHNDIESGITIDKDFKEIVSNHATENESLPEENDLNNVPQRESHALFPTYTCNIYEKIMIVKLEVENVEENSMKKEMKTTQEGCGFSLQFTTMVKTQF
jgi:hypothetical protein